MKLATQAIARQQLEQIDVLLVDLILPGKISGHHLAIQLQSRKPALHLIFTSGYDPSHFENEIKLIEGKNFLGKPYSTGQLQNAFAAIFDSPSEKLTSPPSLPTLGAWQNRL